MCVCDEFLVSALTDGIKGATHQQSPANKNRMAGWQEGRLGRQFLPAAAFAGDHTFSTNVALQLGGNRPGFGKIPKKC